MWMEILSAWLKLPSCLYNVLCIPPGRSVIAKVVCVIPWKIMLRKTMVIKVIHKMDKNTLSLERLRKCITNAVVQQHILHVYICGCGKWLSSHGSTY